MSRMSENRNVSNKRLLCLTSYKDSAQTVERSNNILFIAGGKIDVYLKTQVWGTYRYKTENSFCSI